MNSPRAPISGGYYSLLRVLLGGFLSVHFLHLIPYGAEIFSSAGVLPAAASPLLGYLPNPLATMDSPWVVQSLLGLGAICGVLVALGYLDRLAALAAALILAWLYARNPLIANPSLPVVGWMLIAHFFVPSGPYGSLAARQRPHRWARWHYPRGIWAAAWITLAVAYSYSGYTKLLSPSWVDGTAIAAVLDNPLARDHVVRQWLLAMPDWMLKVLTWSVMWVEVLFVPLSVFSRTRWFAWSLMLVAQGGFLVFLDFADLTFPMLLIHALTFDHRWLPKRAAPTKGVLLFDGWCGFCNGLVRFALAEDNHRNLVVAPLDGDLSRQMGIGARTRGRLTSDSILFIDDGGDIHYQSDAVVRVLYAIGGFWAVPATLLRGIPRTLRNHGYDVTGRWRYRLASRLDESCARIPAEYAAQLRP